MTIDEPSKYKESNSHSEEIISLSYELESLRQERDLLRRELNESQETLSLIFNSTATGICVTDKDGFIVKINPAFCNLFGYETDELIGNCFTKVLPPENHDSAMQWHKKILNEKKLPHANEWEALHKNGYRFAVLGEATCIKGKDNELYKVTSVTDISHIKTFENLLKESENTASQLLNATLESAFLIDANGVFLAANEIGAKRLGTTVDQLIGKDVSEFVPRDIFKNRMAKIKEVIRKKEPIRFQDKRGDIYFDNYFSPILNEKGEVTKIALFAQDITERVMAESALKESESRNRLLLENFPNGFVFVFDHNLRYTFADGSDLNKIGIPKSELLGKTICDYLPAEVCEVVGPHYRAALKGERRLFTLPFKNYTYEVRCLPLYNQEKEIVAGMAVALNITERVNTEKEIKSNYTKFKALFDLAPDAVFLETCFGKIIDCNLAAVKMTGYSRDELIDSHVEKIIPDDVVVDVYTCLNQEYLQSKGGEIHFESINQRKNGEKFPVEVNVKTIELNEENIFLVVVRDITSRKQYEKRLKLFEIVFNNALEGITITDKDANILEVNQAFSTITGYQPYEAIGNNPRILKSDRHSDEFYQTMWDQIVKNGQWEGEIWNRRKSGEVYPEWLSISEVKENKDSYYYVAVFHDITEMKRKENQIRHQAYHDALTDLPNRLLLHDRISVAIAHARRSLHKIAILFIDLDNFKTINDSLGHLLGDKLLQAVAKRILYIMRSEDTVARLGGDEFVIMVENIEKESEVSHVVERLINTFTRPFHIDGHELYITPSIGVTYYPNDGGDAETLIRNADMAMYQAKDQGKNRYKFFTTELNERVQRRLEIERKLRKSIEKNEFAVYYQPRIDLLTGKTCGMEALARWPQSDGNVIRPDEFIPLAEETGLIIPLGEQIMDMAYRAALRLNHFESKKLKIAINLSLRQFMQKNFVQQFLKQIEHIGLLPSYIEVEITETIIMKDIKNTVKKLRALVDCGISISIDDFGKGYSSLYHLKHLPLHILKIDKSFVNDIETDENSLNLVETVIAMAQKMNLKTVAEGVETQSQLEILQDLGCDEVQGYLFSPPVPEQEFKAFLNQHPAVCKMD